MQRDSRLDPDRDIRIFDRALSDTVFERLFRAIREIGDENMKAGYDTTFWYPRGDKPQNIVEKAISELEKLAAPPAWCIGTEWWLGRLAHGKKLPLHFDRDLTRSRKFGQHEYPILGSIFYLNTFPTSATVVLGQIPGDDPRTKVPEKPVYRKSVSAVSNRYAVFRGDLRHGVVPDEKSVADSSDRQNPPGEFRLTLLVNYWLVRPMPPICRDFDGQIYRRLVDDEA